LLNKHNQVTAFMIDQINKLIAINLFLLFVSEQGFLSLREFKDDQGNELAGAKMLAEIMQEKELITPSETKEFSYILTESGKQISLNGGWLKHLEKLKMNKNQNTTHEFNMPKSKIRKITPELVIAGILITFLSILIVSCM